MGLSKAVYLRALDAAKTGVDGFLPSLWRRSRSLADALKRWAAEGGPSCHACAKAFDTFMASESALVPPPSGHERVRHDEDDDIAAALRGRARKVLARDVYLARVELRRIAPEVTVALGKGATPIFELAREKLASIKKRVQPSDVRNHTEWRRSIMITCQITEVVEPLILIFEDPNLFFTQILARSDPGWWERPLPEILRTWNLGALLHPEVRATFERASLRPGLADLLAESEGRQAYPSVGAPQAAAPTEITGP